MALDGTLQHWLNGEPTMPDDDHLDLKYWLNGEPYTLVEGEAAPPPTVKPMWYYDMLRRRNQ